MLTEAVAGEAQVFKAGTRPRQEGVEQLGQALGVQLVAGEIEAAEVAAARPQRSGKIAGGMNTSV